MPVEKRGVAWWFQQVGPVERFVAGTLAAIFLLGVLLIAGGLMTRPEMARDGAGLAPERLTETVHFGAVTR